jgi:ubiquinone/menaquinone biosynthesis C-methylase UbiE
MGNSFSKKRGKDNMNDKRYLNSQLHEVNIDRAISTHDRILDIGGGGEGIIGKLYGKNVVSIDHISEELEETNNESLKIVMRAENMAFLDDSFDHITLFFSLMYMDANTKEKVLKESFRVLRSGGKLKIWDINIPQYNGGEKDIFLAHLNIKLPEEAIRVSYGIKMNEEKHHMDIIKKYCGEIGFNPILQEVNGDVFYIDLVK